MKKLFLSLLLLPLLSISQTCSNGNTPFNCSLNLLNPIYTLTGSVTVQKNLSYSNGVYLSDVKYIGDTLSSACNTGRDSVVDGRLSLIYDVYYPNPKKFSYAGCKLPVVILFHPGGFSDCSDKDKDGQSTYCQELAKRGFVAYNFEYRRGRVKDWKNDLNGNPSFSASQMLAMYRAFQDGRGAVRTVVAIERTGTSKYRVDTNSIFIGGASAGGYIALNVAYCQKQSMIDSVFKGVSNLLGPIQSNYYYGDTSIRYTIKGVINMWGGFLTPKNINPSLFLYQNNYLPPMIAWGGRYDGVVPTDTSDINYAPYPFNRDSLGLSYTYVSYDLPGRDGQELGPTGMYNILGPMGINRELYMDCTMAHGIDNTSDWGTGVLNNKDAARVYQTKRNAAFMQAVLNGISGGFVTTKFVDCENFRYGCSTVDSNDGCSNTDRCP